MTKKLEKKILRTYTVSPTEEIALFPVSKSGKLPNEKMNRTFWEILRRKPEYLELCKEIEFNKITGLESSKWVLNLENRDKWIRAKNRARELFGIEQLVDPRKEYSKLQPDIVNLFGVAPKVVIALSPDGGHQFVQDGRYVTLRIDISERYKYIEPLIRMYVDYFRGQAQKKEGREHYAKQKKYLKIWDERLSGERFPSIAKKMNITLDQAKEGYYRAFELIIGKRYERGVGRQLIIDKLKKARDFKQLLDFEEKAKTEGRYINSPNAVADDNSSVFSDPQAKLLIDDILKEYCDGCGNEECRTSFLNGEFEILQDCPKVIKFLRS